MSSSRHSSGTYDEATDTGGSNGAGMRYEAEGGDPANAGLQHARVFLEPVSAPYKSRRQALTAHSVRSNQSTPGSRMPTCGHWLEWWRSKKWEGLTLNGKVVVQTMLMIRSCHLVDDCRMAHKGAITCGMSLEGWASVTKKLLL